MLMEKKWVKKLPSWQANNFSDLNFFRGVFWKRIFSKFKKWREICGSVDRLNAWNFFRIFFNGICEAEKSVRSWESIAWELREFSKKLKKKDDLEKVEKIGKFEFSRKKLNFKFIIFFVFWLKFPPVFSKFSLIFFSWWFLCFNSDFLWLSDTPWENKGNSS